MLRFVPISLPASHADVHPENSVFRNGGVCELRFAAAAVIGSAAKTPMRVSDTVANRIPRIDSKRSYAIYSGHTWLWGSRQTTISTSLLRGSSTGAKVKMKVPYSSVWGPWTKGRPIRKISQFSDVGFS